MERIRVVSDSPGYIKVREISKELRSFTKIIEDKYNQIDFDFLFCFRALYSTMGINSKVRFDKGDNTLGMDLIMSLDEFNPYKTNVAMQRLIMGKHLFPFFAENIKKYKSKLPNLKSIAEDLTEDMRLFLIDNLWLPDDNGNLKLSVIETVSYEKAMALLGNPIRKKFTNMENGQKIQDLLWEIDKETKILAQYKLIDKIWILQKYKIE
ncbi:MULTISPECIES: hypothetical protein [Bacteroidales]|jgi:hypothetical protein|uniref:Uncharacterized protein n=5 Tax=Bacteroidales TaxID=171549 RepID=A0A413ZR83_BACSE|nr:MULTISPECIES: hypothetical protein [Bacteroidales]MCE9254998.1 hypothetical protein [Bacteroides fragilis]MBT9663456.1 hypothetical protein [Parabacteroides distasonis]MCE9283683.1 hypothetical protein [Bacteroides fragilis]MCG0199413.1 hypothetical protein [Phocaeicola vulgatus]MCG0342114.1 hypothetical protein [Phocaeicola vulgatus]